VSLSTTDMHCTGMASGQLPEFIRTISGLQIRLNHPWTIMSWARCWRPITRSKTQINHRTLRSVAGDLRQPATGTD